MKRNGVRLAVASALCSGLVWAAGCGDDDVVENPPAENFDASTTPEAAPTSTPDASKPTDAATGPKCGETNGAPQRLLLTMNGSTTTEVAAFNLKTNAVDDKLQFQGSLGTTAGGALDPYVLEQKTDVIARLSAEKPWVAVGTWNVHGTDTIDGGSPFGNANADPSAVAEPSCGKAYVTRFTRNLVDVLDTTQTNTVDAGEPTKTIDLTSHLQAEDSDNTIEATGAVYVASHKLVYVLLGNIDLRKVASDGYTALCANTKPTIIAIDPATDAVVPIGSKPVTGIELGGYNPPLGSSFVYDEANDRFLVVSAGCNLDDGDGGAGAIARRRIEAVKLSDGSVSTLVDMNAEGFPTGLVYADATHALVSFFGSASYWNPSQTTLGASVAGGLDFAAFDGKDRFVGARATFLGDGGAGPIEVVSTTLDGTSTTDGGAVTVLGTNPFTDNTGFLSGAQAWPPKP